MSLITFYCYVLILQRVSQKAINSNKMFFWHVSRFGAFQKKNSIKNINDNNNDNNLFSIVSFPYTRLKSNLQVKVNLLYFQNVVVYTTYWTKNFKLGYPCCTDWFGLNWTEQERERRVVAGLAAPAELLSSACLADTRFSVNIRTFVTDWRGGEQNAEH